MHESHAELLRSVDPSALGLRLRAARVAQGLTQSELAGDDVSAGYVSRIESGARRPTLKALAHFAHRLGTPVDQLLRGVSSMEYDEIRLGLDYAELALENGEATEAEHQAREALTRAELASLEEFVARSRYLLGRALEVQGRLDDAVQELEFAIDVGSSLLSIHAAIALSRCHREAGDLTLAIEIGERVIATLPDHGLDRTDEAVQLASTVAAGYIMRGDLSHATRVCADAIERAESLDSPTARSAAYWNASVAHSERGRLRDAVPLATRALALLSEGNDARNLARLRVDLGRLLLNSDASGWPEAVAHLRRANEELHATSASSIDIAAGKVALAEAHLRTGDAELAFRIAADVDATTGPEATFERAEAAVIRAHAAVELGRTDDGDQALREAMELLHHCDDNRFTAQLWFDLAELLQRTGRPDEALSAHRMAALASGLRSRHRPVAANQFLRV